MLKTASSGVPVLIAPNWERSFQRHIEAFKIPVRGTLTQLDESEKDRVTAFFQSCHLLRAITKLMVEKFWHW